MKSKFNLFIGLLLLVLGFAQAFKGNAELCGIDFLLGIINLAIFYFENKRSNNNE